MERCAEGNSDLYVNMYKAVSALTMTAHMACDHKVVSCSENFMRVRPNGPRPQPLV